MCYIIYKRTYVVRIYVNRKCVNLWSEIEGNNKQTCIWLRCPKCCSFLRNVWKYVGMYQLQVTSNGFICLTQSPQALNIYRIVKADGSRAMQQLERPEKWGGKTAVQWGRGYLKRPGLLPLFFFLCFSCSFLDICSKMYTYIRVCIYIYIYRHE